MNMTSKRKPSNAGSLLYAKGMNPGAMAATLSYLDISQSYGLLDKWTEVKCEDGTKARILKNPEDAFEIYAKEWSTKFNVVLNLLEKAKVEAGGEIGNKIVQLSNSLNYVGTTLREMYKNAYLTFAATPCSEKSQEEKRAMDRIIAVASMHLLTFQMMLENKDPKNLDSLNTEILKLIDKITVMIIR
jgi:hypothetical protein